MIDILYELMDQGLVDRDGRRCGRVDDIVVEDGFDRPPRVTALMAGGGAKSRHLWKPLHRLSLWLHIALGMHPPIEPVRIPWERVERVEADVFLDVSAAEAGLDRLNRAVAERFLRHLPGAGR